MPKGLKGFQKGNKYWKHPACVTTRLKKGTTVGKEYWFKSKRKDGKGINYSGYFLIKVKNHPFARSNSFVFEHRLVMEKYLGRYLKPKEKVHHINRIKTDNRIENLQLVTVQNHGNLIKCPFCDKKFIVKK